VLGEMKTEVRIAGLFDGSADKVNCRFHGDSNVGIIEHASMNPALLHPQRRIVAKSPQTGNHRKNGANCQLQLCVRHDAYINQRIQKALD